MQFSVLEVYWTKNQNSTKTFKKRETMSSTFSHLSESGKLFIKKQHHWQKQWLNSSQRYVSPCMKHGRTNSKRTVQAIYNKAIARFLLHQFWTRQNYGTIQLQGTAGETLEKRWRDPRGDPCLMYKPAEKLQWFKRDWHDTWCVVCFFCFSEKYFCKR